ncbi:MAG TPA: 50S ribosomal protein L24 [Thermoanaerobaculia bacterium]|jgi:large subunit ribosomal protein L24|nr:50S ribosomal protein L24 [Thermoanaerobaculia bacterium]
MGMYGRTSHTHKDEARPNKSHVKKGDTVVVLTGKDRGKQGKVLRVSATKGTAIVERVNFFKKHTKPNPQKNIQGGILERESPIQISKLQVICPSCSEPARIGMHRTAEGSSRYCKKCNTEIA